MYVRRLTSIVYFPFILNIVLCEEGKVQVDNISNGHYPPKNVRITLPDGPSVYQCVADAMPAPTFKWSREGLDLPSGVTPEGERGERLRFPDLTSDFNGQYSCEVTNPYGTRSQFIYRHIGKLQVDNISDGHYPPKNVRITLPDGPNVYQCVADAMPAPTFKWSREGLDLPSGVTPEGERGERLRFPDLSSDFNGQYSCEVTNPYGTRSQFIHRHVGKLQVDNISDGHYPPKNVRITLPDGPSVYHCVADAMPAPTFKWSREGLDLPSGVTPEGERGERLRFPDLTSDFNGQYSCEVTNPYGTRSQFIHRYVVDPAAPSKDEL
ncbi:hypothetical protein ACEWY4_022909 [Coilia grayii]|uniref:Ig-like domain-containing protein n=1 Tax=Coilia grayii TaxID=363190 RepID=A0ABD1J1I0_9TELE